MKTWQLIILIAIFAFFYFSYLSYRRQSKLIKKTKLRGNISKSDFINYLTLKGFEEKWISKLYDSILVYVPRKKFSMSPEDNLIDDYKILDDDLVDIAMNLYLERNGKKATQKEIDEAENRGASILTFEGILIFIHKDTHQ